MFDGLKEKLGRFTDEAADVAEEKAEDATGEDAVPEEAEEVAAGEATDQEPTKEERLSEVADEDGAREATAQEEQAEEPSSETTGAAEIDEEITGEAAAPEERETDAAATADSPSNSTTEIDDVAAEADDATVTTESPVEPDTSESGENGGGASFARRAKSLVTGKVILDEDDLEGPLWDLEMALLESDVEMHVAEAILDRIETQLVGETKVITDSTTSLIESALREALLEVVAVGQFDFDERIASAEKPVVIVFTGVNGVGKTTSIAKLSQYLEDRGYSTVLANGDTYRAGANEQIREHAARLDTKLISHEKGGDPTAVLYDAVEYAKANDVDVVLGDTAGRLHTSDDLMAQLSKIDRVVDPDLTLFVDEAVAGQDAVNRAREFDDAASIDGSILTKADADSQGGAAISISHVTGKPILFLGTGQEYDDLARFDPEALVDDLLGG